MTVHDMLVHNPYKMDRKGRGMLLKADKLAIPRHESTT
jgi:hypothetical protein